MTSKDPTAEIESDHEHAERLSVPACVIFDLQSKLRYKEWLMQRIFNPLSVTMELEWSRLVLPVMMLPGQFSPVL
ncbi:hypothetical protein Vadar_007519 [Vaccinium darrowii]|uniref:Uncharacterized protein n=1 Tax=Vaccinium darrowii TaxID=229202 RepID=A0ACB7Z2A5_9ERIC|nr:hypothetical protein Vadar_007519 [Vaccinium darrowii]